MFASSNVVEMFPTYVWVHDLKEGHAKKICDQIFKSLKPNIPDKEQLKGGHSLQSENELHKKPVFKDLMAHVDVAAKNILHFLGKNQSALVVTGCWANVSVPSAYHKEHSHPNNFLSGVFYVKTPKGGDTINFHDPRPEAHVIAPSFEEPLSRNYSTMFVEAKPGRMMIFPSWLRHSVDPNASDELRISVSFNMMFERYAETQSRPRFAATL
tara:strand:+ start:296 stop:931 length:636 start_codon:yes stop_codon:yes gene_type:complete